MFKLEPRAQTSLALAVAAPLLALAITVLIGIVLFTALGKDPVQALRLFFVEPLKDGRALSELSIKAVPLALIALGLAVCFRANIWNIGAEGQFVLGALGAGWVAGSSCRCCWAVSSAACCGPASSHCCATASTPTRSSSA